MDLDWDDIDISLLKTRARQLAEPIDDQDASVEEASLLEFRMMGARYSIELRQIDAVTKIGGIFSVPLTPRHISGVIRRRGQTIALVSLRHFFHPTSEGIVDADFAIIVNAYGKTFAIQADEIEGVIRLNKKHVMPPTENFDRAQAPYLVGVTNDGLAVLDIDRLVVADGFGTHQIRV